MQRIKPINNEIYHIYNRGVEKRKIFLDDEDYFRFIHDLFEFNDQNPTINFNLKSMKKLAGVGLPLVKRKPRKLLVEIFVFCLMPNHFHLIIKQVTEGGVTEFMRKLGTGYTNYFNQKYKRVGALFQGKYKFVHIKKEAHFDHLSFYVHVNSLDLFNYKSSTSINEKINFLKKYRWSSFLDYIGEKNFPSVTSKKLFLDFFGGEKKYLEITKQWIKDNKLEKIKEVMLD